VNCPRIKSEEDDIDHFFATYAEHQIDAAGEFVGEICYDNQSAANSDIETDNSRFERNETTSSLSRPPRASQKTETRVRLRWEERLHQLSMFRARHGHVDVPRNYVSDPSLATFVCNQRQMYKRMNEGKGPSMDQRRINQLDALGFNWVMRHEDQPKVVEHSTLTFDPTEADANVSQAARGGEDTHLMAVSQGGQSLVESSSAGNRSRTLVWEEGIEGLKEFKLQNGHINVPHIFPANQPLGNFVKSIRQHYKQMIQKGKTSKFLLPERIIELENMGFKLLVRARAPWNQRLEELRQYVKRHGNCDVPKHTPLGIWILNQRSQYKLLAKKKPSSMTEDRIRTLNEIGFDWRFPVKKVHFPAFTASAPSPATAMIHRGHFAASAPNEESFYPKQIHNDDLQPPSLPATREHGSYIVDEINLETNGISSEGRLEYNGMPGLVVENVGTGDRSEPSDFVQNLLMERI